MYKKLDKDMYTSKHATIKTKGRAQIIPDDKFRTEFQRDVHRILYSQSFRRLRHKTQVFYFPQNDHVSARLDHVLCVASAARTVARCLGLNEDLAEAIGLAHDLGHAPFGHQGEKILKKIIDKKPCLKRMYPDFGHEIYGLRVVDKIAKCDREKPGLNLTWEVRDGIVSHCGEDFDTCKLIPDLNKNEDLESIPTGKEAGNPATLEGCIVRLIDKVAYCGKDIEDAIAAEIIKPNEVPESICEGLGRTNGKMVGTILRDIIEQSTDKDFVAISPKYGSLMHELIDFNINNIYHCDKSEGYNKQAERALTLLFEHLLEQIHIENRFENYNTTDLTPKVYKFLKEYCDEYCRKVEIYTDKDPDELIILDFIAGMTDTFAVRSFQELFVPQATV